MRQIILDTETTGLSAENGDRIIEIGCVELLNRKFTGNNLHHYVNPERDSHEDALKVHGIQNEFLRTKPKFAAIAEELKRRIGRFPDQNIAAAVIDHNGGEQACIVELGREHAAAFALLGGHGGFGHWKTPCHQTCTARADHVAGRALMRRLLHAHNRGTQKMRLSQV